MFRPKWLSSGAKIGLTLYVYRQLLLQRSLFLKHPTLDGGEWLAPRSGVLKPGERSPVSIFRGMCSIRIG
jgi:hypothetical protein